METREPPLLPRHPAAGEPHLWWAHHDSLDFGARTDAEYTQQERERAARFRNRAAAARYLHGRRHLRCVLSRYLERPALEIGFTRSPFGKLRIDPPESKLPPLFFSLSRTGRSALVGIATTPIGVDIALLQAFPDLEDLVAGTLTSEEAASLPTVGDPDRDRAFLDLWTRKEAYLKGIGIGLHADPRTVCVVHGQRPELRSHVEGLPPKTAEGWWIEDFVDPSTRGNEEEKTCIGAVATQERIRRIRAFRTPLPMSEASGRPASGPFPEADRHES